VEHARTADTYVLAKKEYAIALLEILKPYRTYWAADRLWKSDGGALMAHIGAVRQIVGAVKARKQLV
jgi:hypothetical protein